MSDNKILKFHRAKKVKPDKHKKTVGLPPVIITEDHPYILLEFKNNSVRLSPKEAATIGLTLVMAAKNIILKGK